jgi:5-methylcytosine-specific restriction enzyme A
MPYAAPTPCRHPGCVALVKRPGYCLQHRADLQQWDSAARARKRQQKRAWPTHGPIWRRLRARVLSETPLCAACERNGRITVATVVDHIDGDAMNNARTNLQALCAACHSAKTAREDGGFGNRRRQG